MSDIILGIGNFILNNAGVVIGVAIVIGLAIFIINIFRRLG